jgi:ribosomal protein L16 Arg81 hydroxylase
METDEFLARHWEPQKPLYIPGHETKFADLLDRESFVKAITDLPETGKLQLRVGYTAADDTGTAHGFLGGLEALEHFDRGATICATSLEHAEPRVRRFRDILAAQWPTPDPLIVNCYYSPEGQGFGTHFDPQSVWVMQIEGRKRWFYSTERAVAFPNDGATAMELRRTGSPLLAAAESMQEVELRPGDMLYLPPGTWHRAEAQGYSLALSVSQLTQGTRRLVSRALRNRMLDRVEWRRHFPLPLPGSSPVEPHLERLLAELKDAVNRMTVEELRDLWALMALPSAPAASSAPASERDEVRVATPLAAFADAESQSVTVYRNHQKYRLPWACRALVGRDGESLTAATLAEAMGAPFEEASPLIDDLLQIGVLAYA